MVRFLSLLLIFAALSLTSCSQDACPVANDGRQEQPDYKKDDDYESMDNYPYD